MEDIAQMVQSITNMKNYWYQRNLKFREWYQYLVLVDVLASKGMETYVSNEPMTFYNMAHYLLTRGELSHDAPIDSESALELDRKAKIHRGCEYMWKVIDRERQRGGDQPYVDELSFYLLTLGWYSTISAYDQGTGMLKTQIWNPFEVYPRYSNGRMVACTHSYNLDDADVKTKVEENGWNYATPARALMTSSPMGLNTLDDYYKVGADGMVWNNILINGKSVTDWVARPDVMLLVSPVGGFPDRGNLTPTNLGRDWRRLAGRGIFEVNAAVSTSFNKWKSMVSQILRDTAQPITQEFSASPQATPEQLRERGALFHYAPGEQGIQRVSSPPIPAGVQEHLAEMSRELQKGGFNDVVYGLVQGRQQGYTLSLLSSSSANQILYPYMDGKHFVVGENDRFWLSRLKKSNRTFQIRGRFTEKLKPVDIPDDVCIEVDSDVATPKDWLERGTVANMLREHLDQDTINAEILKVNDVQAVRRKRTLDQTMQHPMTIQIELISSYRDHADYLEFRGDPVRAQLFRKAADALESQFGAPPPGQGRPEEASQIEADREAGTPSERSRVNPSVAPPEATAGFTPQTLRRSLGRGTLKAV